VAHFGYLAESVISSLRESEFRDVAEQLSDQLLAGKVTYVRERKGVRGADVFAVSFEEIREPEIVSEVKRPSIDAKIMDYSPDEASELAKNALRKQFIDPDIFIPSLTEVLQVDSLDSVTFADPTDPSQKVSLGEYASVLESAETKTLAIALDKGI
jgi:hypothetical protein